MKKYFPEIDTENKFSGKFFRKMSSGNLPENFSGKCLLPEIFQKIFPENVFP